MKRSIIPIAAVGLLVVALLLYFFVFDKKAPPPVVETPTTQPKPKNDLPTLAMVQTDRSTVSLHELREKVILIFFNPECDHCQQEAEMISANISVFKDYQLYFISSDSMPAIEKFAEKYKLREPNFHFGHSEGMDVYNSVGPLQTVPAVFIYRDQKLVKRIDGVTAIQGLTEFL